MASTLLGIAITALAFMIGSSDVMRNTSEQYRQARLIAQQELEDDSRHFINYANPAPDNNTVVLNFNEQIPAIVAHRKVAIQTRNEKVLDVLPLEYKVVQVTLAWPDSNPQSSLTLSRRIMAAR